MAINPGVLRDRVEFHKSILTSDGSGGFFTTVTKQFSCPAKVEPGQAVVGLDHSTLQIASYLLVTIRYSSGKIPGIDYLMKWRGDMYRIVDMPEADTYKAFLKLKVARK